MSAKSNSSWLFKHLKGLFSVSLSKIDPSWDLIYSGGWSFFGPDSVTIKGKPAIEIFGNPGLNIELENPPANIAIAHEWEQDWQIKGTKPPDYNSLYSASEGIWPPSSVFAPWGAYCAITTNREGLLFHHLRSGQEWKAAKLYHFTEVGGLARDSFGRLKEEPENTDFLKTAFLSIGAENQFIHFMWEADPWDCGGSQTFRYGLDELGPVHIYPDPWKSRPSSLGPTFGSPTTDIEKAELERLAYGGDIGAMEQLARYYKAERFGSPPIPPNWPKAIGWTEVLAEKGFGTTVFEYQRDLVRMYQIEGSTKSIANALYWYERLEMKGEDKYIEHHEIDELMDKATHEDHLLAEKMINE